MGEAIGVMGIRFNWRSGSLVAAERYSHKPRQESAVLHTAASVVQISGRARVAEARKMPIKVARERLYTQVRETPEETRPLRSGCNGWSGHRRRPTR
jgi:hypothetical protein